MENLEQRIQNIEERNRKVEADKAWETSIARRLILVSSSYLVIAVFFVVIELPNPWLNAIVPALAFVIQQLSMPFFKKLWLKLKKQ
ncbi:hypothetical protein A3I95_03585 [Candidatus Nomurabacteria bacterium RIFCSPLOWO2_02_FULL_44_12]|uniref:2TM domain-containing protein n=1 Tax=Candidatus Nomurabacteria bacterium RIFCSPLOWO2_12_FULL_44_11 TaxID=1801796 RepID=A0A1F6Y827_9BACT|nr:MAG: hypothetical protein A3E95_01830 [Candidatus Nomurabacteria bacterium RIFCSPHIGHO2_12_FULL_44_22b]OGJ02492.1 MAG: hypothetical protein A3G53_01185 [Candidatus Nomurabacteria bacterium RIFCSPLOWO2_12_FULL_44_11]OGJ06890.1 MAG: hypothetical protein A3I95_03585 [Candidatus Nomurabacteria bacterium RIFCSPLOWO2_02_FULL_44_12]